MKSRRGPLVAIAMAAFIVFVTFSLFRGRVVGLRELERVGPGMSRGEVIELLGGNPADYRSDPERFSISHHSAIAIGCEEWIVDEDKVVVWFDTDDCVVRGRVCKAIDKNPPLLHRLADWLYEEFSR